jgi:hypothetical protein
VLSNLYTAASTRFPYARASRWGTGGMGPNLASQILAIFVICCLGVLTGSAAGKGITQLRSGDEKPAAAETKVEAKVEAPAPPTVQPAPQIVAAPVPVAVAPVPKPAAAPVPKPRPVAKAPVAPAPIVADRKSVV